jgi:ABC-type bacteriocin/lantibiotic exporter with double-glycine peptidase domain
MVDELIESVIRLIDSKKGDVGRLNYILSALQDGKTLYASDRKYLDSMISTYLGPIKKRRDPTVEELKTELTRVKQRLEKYEKRGYKKPIGRKAVFFFVTFFFGWHAIVTLLSKQLLYDVQNFNQYLFPLYMIDKVIPVQYVGILHQFGLSIEKMVTIVWGAMIVTWIILGFVYLIKFIRSRYNPVH